MPAPKALITRYPILGYYILTFAISWGILLLVIYAQGGIPVTQDEFARQVSFMIPAMLGGPSLAAVVMTALVSGRAGFRELFSRLLRWRVGVRWYAVALLTAPLVFAAVHAALSLASPAFLPALVTTEDTVTFLLSGILAALMVGLLEELGWTGFATPRLRRRHSVLTTGLIVGVLWGVWHVPFIRLWPAVAVSGEVPLGLFLAVTIFFRAVRPTAGLSGADAVGLRPEQ